jgi:transcription termination factor Rho
MPVLQRKELESSPLADLHAIASELGLEGFRTKRKEELVGAILAAQGGEPETAADEPEADAVPSEEALEGPADVEEEEPPPVEEEPEVEEEEVSDEEIATGTLDILANGSGFLRADAAAHSRDDVYVSPAQIRRCELRAADEVSGPVRPPRRGERHPSLIRVETVNGGQAEPPAERPWFGELTAVYPRERLPAPTVLEAVPVGKGSRVAVTGPPGAGASTLLREIARTLAGTGEELSVQVVLAGVRPEELGEWRELGLPVTGGSFDQSPDAQAQAGELAVERAKRQVERGAHAAVVLDALDALPAGARRRLFGAGRATEEGGTLTVVAATGDDREPLRWATTRIVLEAGGRISSAESGTLRAELLS